jgi:hypothetical protein
MNSEIDGERHMTDLEIAAFVDNGLDTRKRSEIEDHLVRCGECRENVIRTQDIIDRSRRSRRLASAAVVVLAAAAITLIAVPTLRRSSIDNRDAIRADDNTSSLVAYGPIGDLKAAPSRFTWGSLRGAISYRITLTTDTGVAVWSSSVTDTTIVLPASVSLERGTRYMWVVDAVTNDGTTRSTGLREFGIVP